MSDVTRLYARMRLSQYRNNVERRLLQAHKRGGMELRDKVKELQNVPGYQIRQKGETITRGFVIRKGLRIDATARSPIEAKKDETNFDVVRSKPGEPPRRQRGTLYESQTFETRSSFRGVFTRVGPSVTVAKYARALELGYPPNNLEPRPSLGPAARAYAPTWFKLIERATRGAKP